MKISAKTQGYIFALIATLLWASNIIVARNISDSFPPVALAFFRWLVAVILFTPFAFKQLVCEWAVIKKHLPYVLITSFLGISLFNVLFYVAAQTTTALNLSLISISFPVFIIIFSRIFFMERVSIKRIIGIILVISGIIVLLFKGSPELFFQLTFYQGDVLMLFASVLFAIYTILIQKKPVHLKMIPFQYFTFLIGLLFLLPFYLIEIKMGYRGIININSILSIIYAGAFASVGALIMWNKSVSLIGPVKAGILYYTLPIFSGCLAIIFLNEIVFMFHLVSGFLIILGIIISNK